MLITFLPLTIEDYYDYIDAAGRDGLPSTCTIISGPRRERSNNPNDRTCYIQRPNRTMISLAKNENECRRIMMLQNFEENVETEIYSEDCCDACESKIFDTVPLNLLIEGLNAKGNLDVSDDARDLMRMFAKVNISGGRTFLGKSIIISIFRGEKLCPYRPSFLQYFGKGSKKSYEYWSGLLNVLIQNKILEDYYNDVDFNECSRYFLHRKSLKVLIDPKKFKDFRKLLERTTKRFIVYESHDGSGQLTYRCVNEEDPPIEITSRKRCLIQTDKESIGEKFLKTKN